MNEKLPDPSNETGLREYVDAEFMVEELDSPVREKALVDALEKVPGLDKLSVLRGNLTVHYDPVHLSRKRLEEAIESAGFHISETHATASSPLTDALIEENKPSKNP